MARPLARDGGVLLLADGLGAAHCPDPAINRRLMDDLTAAATRRPGKVVLPHRWVLQLVARHRFLSADVADRALYLQGMFRRPWQRGQDA